MKAEMATSVPSEKVRDKEYTNWLKVTLALYYMKSGLHTFIQSEFNCLHQSLVQKIYGGQKVPLPPCSMCHASLVKRNKYTGTWAFRNQCGSYCDVWLYELLVLHTNPKSEKIYWDNTNVPSWPFTPWQCAKVFMPRGQLPSSTGPAECDAQALLALLSNCKHFQRKLSRSGQSLTHTVSAIRNKVMHNGEMKLSDTDRNNYIQQIIQLLEDPVSLKSTEDCKAAVGNICKIDNDPVDVFFNVGLEITAMREAVNELRRELGNQERGTAETLDKLKEEYEQLREQVRKRFEDVEKELILHENRMDTIERDIESVKEKTDTALQQHEKKLQEMHTTVTSEQKRFEDVETKMDTTDRDIQSVKEETESLLQQQEKNTQMTEILYERVASQDVRLLAVEENVSKLQFGQKTEKKKSCRKDTNAQKRRLQCDKDGPAPKRILSKKQGTNAKKRRLQDDKNGPAPKRILSKKQETVSSETLSKRRPETEGLKHLKRQTEDKVDSIRRLECILTIQAEKAKILLEEKRSVVIKGNPGEGKTTTALYLIDNEIYTDRRVVVYSPTDWKMVDTDWVDIIVIEDIFGQSDLDPDLLEEWMVYLPTIQEHVDAEKLQVIITTRVNILSKAYPMLGSLKLFSADLSLMLSSEKLERSEKMGILNRELRRCKRNMKEDQKEQCIANFHGLIGFPQCCSLFAGDDNLFNRGPDFFKSPNKYFAENINKLKDTAFLSLAFLFCSRRISEEYLSSESMPESGNCLLDELTSCLQISKKKASITLLRDAYDRFLGLYVVKSISYQSYFSDRHSCIEFAYAIIYEAVGHILGNRCPEMIIKYGTSEFLYQQTYTAAAKDILYPNVFLPVCVYSLLAERMVSDVVKNKLVKSVVKHSALKQSQFVLNLEKELLKKRNGAKKFLMTHSHRVSYDNEHTQCFNSLQDSSFRTFLEFILEADADTVRLVHNHFLKFLACAQKNTIDCWKCKKKQELLELALYYHHFEIADKLITMNACYTYTSLSTAARHDDLIRVQTILESLKMNTTFSTKCQEAKKALCNAYISGNQSIIDWLLMEGITLEGRCVRYVVQHGNMNALLDIVEHLRCHNKWIPHWDIAITDKDYCYLDSCMFDNAFYISDKIDNHPFSTALYLAYANEKLDMADCLVKNRVKVSMGMLENLLKYSQKTVETLIQHLKDGDTWNPKCDVASKALEKVYREQKDDLCELLIRNGVLLSMNNLPGVTNSVSLDTTKKAIQHLIDSGEWNPKCDVASEALEKAFSEERIEVCELLIQNGVSLTMKNLPPAIYHTTLKTAEKAIQNLKETGNWNPMCDDASKALEEAYMRTKSDYNNMITMITEFDYDDEYMDIYTMYTQLNDECRDNDIYTPLTQNGVSFTMKNLFCLFFDYDHVYDDDIDTAEEVIKDLKDAGKWDPKCASEALKEAYKRGNYELRYSLIHNGVSLTMADLPGLVAYIVHDDSEFFNINKVIKHLKDTGNWNPKCDAASTALEIAFENNCHDVHELLIQEGAPLPLEQLPTILRLLSNLSSKSYNKVIQNLKDTGNWNPKRDAVSKALVNAYLRQDYVRCDLLIQEGVSLTMKNLPGLINVSLKTVGKAIQHLKDTGNWHPNCDDASKSLEEAFCEEKFDTCELLIHVGVSLTMKNLPGIINACKIVSLATIEKAIQHLKDTNNWNPKCDDASEALKNAFGYGRYDVCNLLIHRNVSLTMKDLPSIMDRFWICELSKSIQTLKDDYNLYPYFDDASEDPCIINRFWKCDLMRKVIQHLKNAGNWDPVFDDASEDLKRYFCKQDFDVCDLLIQNGVSLTMKNLCGVISGYKVSLKHVEKAIQHLKDTGTWDPECDDASEALEKAFQRQMYDVCELLIREGVVLTMKNLPGVQTKSVMQAIHHLIDTGKWNPKCDDASKTLENAFCKENYDMCNLLIQEGVSLTMKNLPGVICEASLQTAEKAIQNLKDTGNWDPKCDNASVALEKAFCKQKFDVCELLIHDGISLGMKNLLGVINVSDVSLETIKRAIQNLKDTGRWYPKCDNASVALEKAFCKQMFDVCQLLIQDGISLGMKNLPAVTHVSEVSLGIVDNGMQLKTANKAIQNLKDTGNWDPKCSDASKALEIAYLEHNSDVLDILIQEEVSLTMKNLPGIVGKFQGSLEVVKNAILHMKDTGSWYPTCSDASEALENAYRLCDCYICDLLIHEGVMPTVKTLPWWSLESVAKAVQYLKDSGNWDPKCDDASRVSETAYHHGKYDVCDLLIQEGVSLTVKTLPWWSLKSIIQTIQFLKATSLWDPKCEDVSKALINAYTGQNFDVCDLLIQNGASLTVKTLPWWSSESVTQTIQFLKATGSWDPKCEDVSKALINAYTRQNFDVCDLLIQNGASLTVKTLPWWSLESVTQTIQFLKATGSWDPKCDDVSKALINAYTGQKFNVCDLLIQNGASLTVKTLPWWSLESVTQTIQILKGTGNWDPKCDDVCRSLENAYTGEKYDVCELLIKEGAPLTMGICSAFHRCKSPKSLSKLIQALKATNHWDPSSEDAEILLARAKRFGRKDLCEVLIEEGVFGPDAKDSDQYRIFPML